MRIVICGGRDRYMSKDEERVLRAILKSMATEVITGGATGIDTQAANIAVEMDIRSIVFHADWELYGKSAGPYRNAKMARYGDILVAFPGGKGTESMVKFMHEQDKLVIKIGWKDS